MTLPTDALLAPFALDFVQRAFAGGALVAILCGIVGTWVIGTKNGAPRETFAYQMADAEETWSKYGLQVVGWQTGFNPTIAMELLATNAWSGAGVLGPEAFDAVPFLDLLTEYGSPWGQREMPVT